VKEPWGERQREPPVGAGAAATRLGPHIEDEPGGYDRGWLQTSPTLGIVGSLATIIRHPDVSRNAGPPQIIASVIALGQRCVSYSGQFWTLYVLQAVSSTCSRRAGSSASRG
jgi:hypothetical protein